LIGAYRVVRLWKLGDNNRLEAFANSYRWTPGVNVAKDLLFGYYPPKDDYDVIGMGRTGAGLHGWLSTAEASANEPESWEMALSGKTKTYTHYKYVRERVAVPSLPTLRWDICDPGDYNLSDVGYSYEEVVSLRPVEHKIGYVVGTTMNWGSVAEGELGIRSQYAIPESLTLTGDLDWDLRLMECADHYGVTVMSKEDLEKTPLGFIEGWYLPEGKKDE
jgi:hypothetical protein